VNNDAELSGLIEETYRSLNVFLRYLGLPDSDIDDMMQEVYLKAFKAYDRYDASRSFKSWLFSIAKNTFIDWTRKEKTKQKYLQMNLSEKFNEGFEGETNSRIAVERILKNLDEDEQVLIELRFYQNLPFKEIAELVGISSGAVKMRVLRILKKIKDNWNRCENVQNL
jgi:RNA polymerase sigma-70 factor (ECF subfamily)